MEGTENGGREMDGGGNNFTSGKKNENKIEPGRS